MLLMLPYEVDFHAILLLLMLYEADFAACLPMTLSHEADVAAILLLSDAFCFSALFQNGGWPCTALRAQ